MLTPMSANEAGRLQALRRYQVLDTPPEPNFDAMARLAAYVCGTPMALISLVDADRQWSKARVMPSWMQNTSWLWQTPRRTRVFAKTRW
jgi:hypothetical protein